MGPLPPPPFGLRDYRPDYAGSHDLNFSPHPFPPGPIPLPGEMLDSPYLIQGHEPHLSQLSTGAEEMAADFSPQVVTPNTATSKKDEP